MGKIRLVFVAILAVGVLSATAAAAATPWVHQWTVNVDGTSGRLELAVGGDGVLTGTALGHPITGRLVGRHLILSCDTKQGVEIWEGWVSSPKGASTDATLIAGTVTRPGVPFPLPWYATAAATDEALQPQAAPSAVKPHPLTQPPIISSTVSPQTTTTAAPARPTPPRSSASPTLAGTWRTPDGPLEIRQEGAKITIILPDREVPGRVVGPETIIAGFAPGCCKGTLKQGFRAITWSNGITWYR